MNVEFAIKALEAIRQLAQEEMTSKCLVPTGEAAATVRPGMDRRTFKAWAKRAGVSRSFLLSDGSELYFPEDVAKVASFYKEQKGRAR